MRTIELKVYDKEDLKQDVIDNSERYIDFMVRRIKGIQEHATFFGRLDTSHIRNYAYCLADLLCSEEVSLYLHIKPEIVEEISQLSIATRREIPYGEFVRRVNRRLLAKPKKAGGQAK